MSPKFALLLRPTLRQTALRPLPGYARSFNSPPTLQNSEVDDALEALSEDPNEEDKYSGPLPDLDIDFTVTSPTSAGRGNQPPLMNIPPQEDPLLHYLASCIMRNGNRAKANKIVSRTLLNLHAYTRQPPLPLLRNAIFACAPLVKVLNHKHSTKMVYKPVALSEKQGIWFAVDWLLKETKYSRQGGPMLEERLAREVIKILKGNSEVLKKKETMHKLAMVNRGNMDGLR